MRVLMMVTFYLRVNRSQYMGTSGRFFKRMVSTDRVPAPGERIVLWPSTEDRDPVDGPMWEVKERYMAWDGSWHVDLLEMRVNPEEALLRAIQTESGRTYMASWHEDSEVDGLVEEKLIADGKWIEGP